MRIIYLAAHIANHPNYDIDYQDITGKREVRSAGQIELVKDRQGGNNVHEVIEYWLGVVKEYEKEKM